MNNGALLIFTRAPLAGKTKTRLAPLLGAAGAARFHRDVLLATLEQARRSEFGARQLWCAADDPFLRQCCDDFHCSFHLQRGRDLGDRMRHAAATALAGAAPVVVIGSDCPALDAALLNRARRYLNDGKDAVLGAAEDGGYYLIGFSGALPEVFQGIAWGGRDVAADTRAHFRRLRLDYAELPVLADVDTPDDYRRHLVRAAGGTRRGIAHRADFV